MARVNYQREKRLKDLERQRKQEEKRNKKLQKGQAPSGGEVELGPDAGGPEGVSPEGTDPEGA